MEGGLNIDWCEEGPPGYTYITDVDAGRIAASHPLALAGLDVELLLPKVPRRQFQPKIRDGVLVPGPEDAAVQGPIRRDLFVGALIQTRVARDGAGRGAAHEAGEEEGRVVDHAGGCCGWKVSV